VRAPVALAGFAAALAVVFAGTYAVGAAVDPVAGSTAAPAAHPNTKTASDGPTTDRSATDRSATEPSTSAALPGLTVSTDGYTLRPARTVLSAGTAVPFAFAVTGPDGRPVTRYRPTHERELHLVVVHRDLVHFQHVHPSRAADGTWRVPLDLSRAGSYRVFADFAPATGQPLVLGTDIAVGGAYAPAPLPAVAGTAPAGDLEVAVDARPVAGRESTLEFRVTRDGTPVRELEPYLGAYGHLVALRSGDLAYLHTHAVGDRDLRFATTFPTAGTYRLFLDIKAGGTVRTAAFTVTVGGAGDGEANGTPVSPTPTGDGHGHP
jgi:hypothetical protein